MKLFWNQKLKEDEQGITAIVVTAILLVIVSITTLGFAQVVRREQRQALDNQLATQAFYAAESGVNLAKSKLSTFTGNKTDCGETAPFTTGDFVVSNSTDVHITCLMIENELPRLQFQNVTDPRITKLKDRNNRVFARIYIAWSAQNGSTTMGCASAGSLPSLSGIDTWNCGQPLVRADLVPICETNGCLTQANLAATQSTMFLYPTSSAPKPTVITATNARAEVGDTHRYAVGCNATTTTHPRYCVAQIDVSGDRVYGLRLSSLYGAANISVYADTTGGPAVLIEGQTKIDSTARAIDVTKRVQTHVGTADTEESGPLTITGTGLCKRYFITDSATTATGSILDPNNPCGIN